MALKKSCVRVAMLVLAGLVAVAVPVGAQTEEAGSGVPAIAWGPCPAPPDGIPDAGQQCATLRVPLDYRAPNGRKIDIAISRVRSAKPELRRGVLLSNPGGPGGPGLDLPRLFTVLLPAEVLDRYDLIGFDPRFIGLSTPISCGLSAEDAFQALVPLEQPGGFRATASFMREAADSCARASGGLLPFATTANTARDMERIRQALGEATVSYLGYSYGTYLGAVYASLFPGRTDRFVLDSSVSPEWLWREQFRSWGPAGEVRFPEFATFAAANDATYHLGDTPAEIRALFFELVERLDENPIPPPPDILPPGTLMNGPVFRELTFGGLYNDADFPALAATWQLANGDEANVSLARQLAQRFTREAAGLDGPVDNGEASALAILCDDAPWPRSVPQYERDFNADSRRFPLFGRLGSNIWPCAFWPNRPLEPPVPITSNGPTNILIVQNLRDPATPLEGALAMRNALGRRARLVKVDQGGHAVYLLTPNTCANRTTTAFLAQAALPGGDVLCPADPPPVRVAKEPTARDQAAQELRRRMRR